MLALLISKAAAAGEPGAQPSPERIKAAAEEFDRGRRAFLAKEYEQAAGHFENAYRDAPSKETLRLAIRARRDAKQLARAATLAAVATAEYASDAPTMSLAKETLGEASKELSEYVIECSRACTITADGRLISLSDKTHHRLFLDPGAHDLGVSFQQGGSRSQHIEGKRGQSAALAFEPPPEPPPPKPPPPKPPPPPPEPPPPTKPLGPAVFFVGLGVTTLAGAATIVSGIDTQNNPGPDAVRRECAGLGESCALYQEGQASETRTNIVLGVTVGAAVITGIIGVVFTQWSSPPSKRGSSWIGPVRF